MQWENVLLIFSSIGLHDSEKIYKDIAHYEQFLYRFSREIFTVHVRSMEVESRVERETAGTIALGIGDGKYDLVVLAGTKPLRQDDLESEDLDGVTIVSYKGPLMFSVAEGMASTHQIKLINMTDLTIWGM